MKIYKVVYSKTAVDDLKDIVSYIKSIYRLEAGLKYIDRISEQVDSLSYCADALSSNRSEMIKKLYPEAKTISIMNHRWTAVFHIYEDFVIIDRIIPSKMIIE